MPTKKTKRVSTKTVAVETSIINNIADIKIQLKKQITSAKPQIKKHQKKLKDAKVKLTLLTSKQNKLEKKVAIKPTKTHKNQLKKSIATVKVALKNINALEKQLNSIKTQIAEYQQNDKKLAALTKVIRQFKADWKANSQIDKSTSKTKAKTTTKHANKKTIKKVKTPKKSSIERSEQFMEEEGFIHNPYPASTSSKKPNTIKKDSTSLTALTDK